eukprot:1308716-Ditylum_brightwellii.AAC.1
MKSDISRGLEVYADISFTKDWAKSWSKKPTSVLRRTGFVVKYANCLILWTSKLQNEITLSSTNAKYRTLSHAMREFIPSMRLWGEMKEYVNISVDRKAESKYTVFQDGYSELVNYPRMRPRTKHIGIKHHHFKINVYNESVLINSIKSDKHQAELLTKNL